MCPAKTNLTIRIPPSGANTSKLIGLFFGDSSDIAEYIQNYCFKQDHILYNYCSLRDAISKYEDRQSNPCHDVEFENDMKSMSSFMDFVKAQQRGDLEERVFSAEILI